MGTNPPGVAFVSATVETDLHSPAEWIVQVSQKDEERVPLLLWEFVRAILLKPFLNLLLSKSLSGNLHQKAAVSTSHQQKTWFLDTKTLSDDSYACNRCHLKSTQRLQAKCTPQSTLQCRNTGDK